MHGAYFTGLREAGNIAGALARASRIPGSLEGPGAAQAASEAAAAVLARHGISSSGDIFLGRGRGRGRAGGKGSGWAGGGGEDVEDDEAGEEEEAEGGPFPPLPDLVRDLFLAPDLEFGLFAAVFDPRGAGPAPARPSLAVLRVDLRQVRGSARDRGRPVSLASMEAARLRQSASYHLMCALFFFFPPLLVFLPVPHLPAHSRPRGCPNFASAQSTSWPTSLSTSPAPS